MFVIWLQRIEQMTPAQTVVFLALVVVATVQAWRLNKMGVNDNA